ncbi:MAG: IS110 family transposase [Tepidiformaceae bacterium]
MLEKIHLNAAGIDIGSESHWVAVPGDRDDQPVRQFPSFTQDLHALADWLEACGIETVAMESTGVYWIPLYEILEERGFEVLLVNARHVKGVPGRKTDVLDCQWIQQLHTFGLLRGSFRPTAPISALRSLVRHRDQLVEAAASYIQRMQKALVLMNLQLHNVISDVSGVTGIAILRDIAAGKTDPAVLARHRHPRCQATEEQIAASLTGHYREEHVFVLRQALELYDVYQATIRRCDEEIEAKLRALQADCEVSSAAVPKSRRSSGRSANEPAFDLRAPLFGLCGGVDLSELPGIAPYGALKLVSEIGLDMSRWASEKHFTAWLTLAPRPEITGGKVLRSRTQPSANRVAKLLRMAAMSLGRSDHALGAFYRRLAARVGKAKAITATARKLAILVYRMLRDRMSYREVSGAEYDQQQRPRILRGLRKRAASLGFELVDTQTGLVM